MTSVRVVSSAPPPTPIRDTSGQDRVVSTGRGPWRGRLIAAAVVAAVVAVGVIAGLRWLDRERSVDAARLRTAEVTRGTLVRDAAVTGRVVAAVSPTLYAPVPGTVTLAIRAGDAVKRGDVLATIDSPELTSELRREESTLLQLAAQRGGARIASDKQRLSARREADEAEIALTTAQRELQAAEKSWAAGVITELEIERARDAVKNAQVRHAHAKAEARLAGQSTAFDVESVQQQHERQRLAVEELRRRVAELRIAAPVDGVVGTLSVTDRAVVAANAPLLTVVDLSQLEVELEVPETYADDLGLGMTVEVRLGAATASGTLSALSPEVVGNHVLARMRFAGAQPGGLRQSQRVTARILIEERPDVLMVARGPFVDAHGGRFAYVVDGDRAVRRPIRIGAVSVGAVEILEGLKPGERVVIAGSEDFEDATAVQIND